VGGYLRGIADKVLRDYGVIATCTFEDADSSVWDFVRDASKGKSFWVPYTFDRGLAAYPPDALREICAGLGLEPEFDAIVTRIIALGGWVGPRG
jgi:hypothetical protein